MIEINNLVKKYGDHTAVDHLSLVVEPGKIYGFLGPNGAGKSTTMNMITGYLGATSGEIKINGHDILKEPEKAKKCIGYLPELPPLYMDMTVKEYLCFVADLKQLEKSLRRRYVEEAMETTGTTEVAGRMIRNLSKGYRQRVGLAQAILGFPEIIILDEPTVGLDPKQIIEIRELIRELAKKHTVILSSHILAEIREVCDFILIISKGKLVASDTPDRLEEKMSGTETVEILAKASAAEVRAILLNVEHISNIHTQERADKTCSARIQTEGGCDIREALFFAFAKNECPLLELQTSRISLEEVFLELTQNDAVGEEERTNAGNL